MRGWVLREAGIAARPTVVSGRPEVDGSDDDDINSGGRGSGVLGVEATAC